MQIISEKDPLIRSLQISLSVDCDGVGKNSLGTSNISGLSFILKVAHIGIGLFIKRERSGFSHQQETNCIYLHHFCDKIKLENAV